MLSTPRSRARSRSRGLTETECTERTLNQISRKSVVLGSSVSLEVPPSLPTKLVQPYRDTLRLLLQLCDSYLMEDIQVRIEAAKWLAAIAQTHIYLLQQYMRDKTVIVVLYHCLKAAHQTRPLELMIQYIPLHHMTLATKCQRMLAHACRQDPLLKPFEPLLYLPILIEDLAQFIYNHLGPVVRDWGYATMMTEAHVWDTLPSRVLGGYKPWTLALMLAHASMLDIHCLLPFTHDAKLVTSSVVLREIRDRVALFLSDTEAPIPRPSPLPPPPPPSTPIKSKVEGRRAATL